MLLVVCPNLAVDRVLTVEGFRSSALHRCRSAFSQPGGKGSNVARVFRQLGGEVALTGFVGRRNAAWIVEPLRESGIEVETIEGFPGESRTCTIICEPDSTNHPTVINEESPEIEPGAADAFLAMVDRWLGSVNALLVTGSLARGLPTGFYRQILELAASRGVFAGMDATGPVLSEGLLAFPSLVKANLEEMSSAMGYLGTEPKAIAAALMQRKELLPQHILVTFGESGALLVHAGRAWFTEPPRVSPINPIGAGDAFAAGYLKSLLDGGSPDEALRFATAVASSDASTIEPGVIRIDEIPSLLSQTSVREL